jgi:hypothetical protein
MKKLPILLGIIFSLSAFGSTLEDREKLEEEIQQEEERLKEENENFDDKKKSEVIKEAHEQERQEADKEVSQP